MPLPFVLTMPPCSTDVRGAQTLLYPGGGALVEVGLGISLAAFLTGRNICTESLGAAIPSVRDPSSLGCIQPSFHPASPNPVAVFFLIAALIPRD